MSDPRELLVITRTPAHFADLADVLHKRNMTVTITESLFDGLATAMSHQFDTALLDLEGLRSHDLEAIQTLRRFRPEMGVIAVAHPSLRQSAADALARGADLYVLKPVTTEELVLALERVETRRELERMKARQADRLQPLAQMALGVAHEINNPLTTISGWLQMLADDHSSDLQLAGVLRSMKEESDRIAEVVRQLLLFAQQQPPRREPVAIRELIADAVKVCGVSGGRAASRIDAELPDKLPVVQGDRTQLAEAFRILIGQAETVMNGNGRIFISGRSGDHGVEVKFQDNGPAIPEEQIHRLFDPFHAGRSGNGSGVGLARAHGIIRSHGGRINAANVDGGVCLTVWLPAET